MPGPNQELFEAAVCDWLAEHGGYGVKNDKLADAGDFDGDSSSST